ncbi:AbrB family transcriptional regulator [Vibrio tritonius]|nr:AbrB family transcriptional regulator [Vibrio tritonius]
MVSCRHLVYHSVHSKRIIHHTAVITYTTSSIAAESFMSLLSTHYFDRKKERYWLELAVLSFVISVGMQYFSFPAAFLLGPMFAAILFAQKNRVMQPARPLIRYCQSTIGVMISLALPIEALSNISQHLMLFFGGVFSVLIASTVLSGILAYRRVVPGTVAIWGSSPGAATVMTLMAQDHGADVRLVALMQYLRVIMVSLAAALVTHFFMPVSGLPTEHHIHLYEPIVWPDFINTLILISVSVIVSKYLKLPSGPLIIAIVLAITVNYLGLFTIVLPTPYLFFCYAIIGWNIGARFTGEATRYAIKIMPNICISILLLIGFCSLLSLALVRYFDIDPLTAYLAMSPGGADSIAIIASTSHNVNVSFVMAMQTCRLFFMLIFGPILATKAAQIVERLKQNSTKQN